MAVNSNSLACLVGQAGSLMADLGRLTPSLPVPDPRSGCCLFVDNIALRRDALVLGGTPVARMGTEIFQALARLLRQVVPSHAVRSFLISPSLIDVPKS